MSRVKTIVNYIVKEAPKGADEDTLTELLTKKFSKDSAIDIATAIGRAKGVNVVAAPDRVTFPNSPRIPEKVRSFDLAAHHNAVAGDIVSSIIVPIVKGGGETTDIIVLTESILVGVALYCIKTGGDEIVLDEIMQGAKSRLAEIRKKETGSNGNG